MLMRHAGTVEPVTWPHSRQLLCVLDFQHFVLSRFEDRMQFNGEDP